MSQTIFNLHDTLLLATSFQSLLFVLMIVFLKRDLHLSDIFLIGFFFCQAVIPIHLLVIYGEEFSKIALAYSPNLFRTFDIAFWLEGPLLLWYTRSLLFKEFHFRASDLLYLLPAAVYLVYGMLTYFSWETAEKAKYIDDYHELLAPSIPHLVEGVRELIFVAFGMMCLIEIRHAQQQVHHRYSNIEKIDFAWLASLVVAFMVIRAWMLLVVGLAFIQPDLGPEPFNAMGLAGNYLMFGMINVLIFFSLTRSAVFAGKISKKPIHPEEGDQEAVVDEALTLRIQEHMETHKPYLSHYLNLDELANQLSMHPRAVSVAIKNNFHTNFYEFINSYRINEAKRLLEVDQKPPRTMIDILGDAGFNSKATFNSFFKKLVGMTPTQYRRTHAKNDS